MAFKKITDADVKDKGNVGRPDTPGVSTAEMQRIMDEIPREVIIPAFNALIDALTDKTSAATLGITAPEGIAGSTVQEVVNALLAYVNAHKNDQENPHAVTAAQVDAYTKKQTDDAISKKVTEIGAGDMTQAVYDPTGQRKDIFAAAMLLATYDPHGRRTDIFKEIDAVENKLPYKYNATFTLDKWSDSTVTDKTNGYPYRQTATLIPDKEDAPNVTPSSTFASGCGVEHTGVAATDDALDGALSIINEGKTVTGYQTVTTIVKEKPTAEITVRWEIMQ